MRSSKPSPLSSLHVPMLAGTMLLASVAALSSPLAAQAAAPRTPAVPAANAAGTPVGTPATAQPAAPAVAPRQSWTADRRNFVVGDIVTVLIDDYTISTAVKENIASDQRTRGLGLDAQLPSSSKRVGLDTRNTATQQQRGSARRENRFQNEMSVRVVAVGANGLLQVKGTKKIDVDKAKQDIEFSGWVRAQDISAQNYVESNRVADVSIGYASPGNLAKPKQGMLSKVLGAIWP
ncbi:MAG: flagellar basal body L-ring protein FlgH [Gemmatimonadota bacterium]